MSAEILLGNKRWLAPGRFRWAKAIVWLFALAAICVGAFNLAADVSLRLSALIAGDAFTTRADAPTGARLIAVIVGSITMLVTYAVAVRLVEIRNVPELGLRQLIPELATGLAIGGILIVAIIGSMWAAGWVAVTVMPITQITESLKQPVQSGVIEEVLMRLIVFRLLWRATGVAPAIMLSALLFGALHLSNPDATVFAALCLLAGEGVGIGLYLLTGRVWMSIGWHAGWNFTQGWIFGGMVSGLDVFAGGPLQTRPTQGISTTFSGGGFGPESSISALIVSLIASILVLRLAWKKRRFAEVGPSNPSHRTA